MIFKHLFCHVFTVTEFFTDNPQLFTQIILLLVIIHAFFRFFRNILLNRHDFIFIPEHLYDFFHSLCFVKCFQYHLLLLIAPDDIIRYVVRKHSHIFHFMHCHYYIMCYPSIEHDIIIKQFLGYIQKSSILDIRLRLYRFTFFRHRH